MIEYIILVKTNLSFFKYYHKLYFIPFIIKLMHHHFRKSLLYTTDCYIQLSYYLIVIEFNSDSFA